MRHFLVTPTDAGVSHGQNPGWGAITGGIRHLIRRADPEAVFYTIDMLRDVPEAWDLAASQAETLSICGNPRLGTRLDQQYDWTLWERVLALRARGIRVADLFAGVHLAEPFPSADAIDALCNYDRARQVLAWEGSLDLVIGRDRLFLDLARRGGVAAAFVPCSSWWAHHEYGIQPGRDRQQHAIAVRIPEKTADWLPARLVEMQRNMSGDRPTLMLTMELADFHRMREAGAAPLVHVADFPSLLRIFGRTAVLLSLRVHSSIPALSMGLRVANVAVDSRSLTLEPFAVSSHLVSELADKDFDPIECAQRSPFGDEVEDWTARFVNLFSSRMLGGRCLRAS